MTCKWFQLENTEPLEKGSCGHNGPCLRGLFTFLTFVFVQAAAFLPSYLENENKKERKNKVAVTCLAYFLLGL